MPRNLPALLILPTGVNLPRLSEVLILLQHFQPLPVSSKVIQTPNNNWSDKELVSRVLNNNTQAFGIIIKNTERLVAGIIFKMIENAEDRKDLAQDVYLKAFKKLPGFKFQSKLSTWIAQITYNTCIDYLKRKKLVLAGELNDENETASESSLTTDTDRPQLKGILHTAIEKLPPLYKTLITLYHHEEMSYGELKLITGLPEGTIKSYLFRARKALKNSLLDTYKKEDL